jgi:hypothetical protein
MIARWETRLKGGWAGTDHDRDRERGRGVFVPRETKEDGVGHEYDVPCNFRY